mmetsp:Transcript_92268/g.247452  ORF Transcript_92268/g.247452 Transcript_92268/m.247452 type:complete len:206 (-) Transcript_92268:745-1362(-)
MKKTWRLWPRREVFGRGFATPPLRLACTRAPGSPRAVANIAAGGGLRRAWPGWWGRRKISKVSGPLGADSGRASLLRVARVCGDARRSGRLVGGQRPLRPSRSWGVRPCAGSIPSDRSPWGSTGSSGRSTSSRLSGSHSMTTWGHRCYCRSRCFSGLRIYLCHSRSPLARRRCCRSRQIGACRRAGPCSRSSRPRTSWRRTTSRC